MTEHSPVISDEEIAEVGMNAWEEYADILSEQMSVRDDAYQKEQWQIFLRKAIAQAQRDASDAYWKARIAAAVREERENLGGWLLKYCEDNHLTMTYEDYQQLRAKGYHLKHDKSLY